jgi:phosphate transport system permease protein
MSEAQAPVHVAEIPQERASALPRGGNLARRKLSQSLAFALVWLAALLGVGALVWVVGYVLVNGLRQVSVEFLTTRPAGGMSGEGGMSTTIVATLYLALFTMAVATPLGVGAAVYLNEYAAETQAKNKFLRRLIALARSGIELLAGVPSIIFGLFGFALFVVTLKYLTGGFSILSAGLAGACLILPVIIRTTEEALLAVPQAYREGSLALGATRWQTTINVVLPTALPGIVTGGVLSVGRIVAETAIFWVTIGGSYLLPTGLRSSGRPMALHVYMLATETRAFEKAMATAAVLILTIVVLNLAVNVISRRFSARLMGSK